MSSKGVMMSRKTTMKTRTDMKITQFQFEGRAKVLTYVLMALGVIALVYGMITDHSHGHQRWWANLLVNSYFYFSIGLGGLFFYALLYATESGWSAVLKRIFEAIFAYLPIGAATILIVLLAGQFQLHHLYHWMDSALYFEFLLPDGSLGHEAVAGAIANPEFDAIISGKSAYFSTGFFWSRTLVYLATFLIFAKMFRKWSLEEDRIGGTELHFKMYRRGALFLVFFAVFSSTMSWDWIMSIDVHWFSTLFGWYVFSGMWVSMLIFATVCLTWLRARGSFPQLTDSHMHDMGKWVFAGSMLWSYLFFSQFMLIWYSNIPEEVTYYIARMFTQYKVPFAAMFLMNFAVPFYVLLSRDAKRNPYFIIPVSILIFFGHYLDVYLLVVPGTLHEHAKFGFLELGTFLGFLGLFIHVVLRAFASAPMIPVNHPFLEESKALHI
jgi:hypothetical protein